MSYLNRPFEPESRVAKRVAANATPRRYPERPPQVPRYRSARERSNEIIAGPKQFGSLFEEEGEQLNDAESHAKRSAYSVSHSPRGIDAWLECRQEPIDTK